MTARHHFRDIEGVSPEILHVKQEAELYARSEETVLLRGETGTGKELFAQAIHNASPQRNGPFVAVNCAALPPTLLESELFGYEEGAFTGANRRGKTGFFELADQGTIFLDEVSGLDGLGQSRLLRVLQERSILRLGSDAYIPVNFRVIAASNVDLWPMVQRGEFRQDLFFRLHVLPLIIPSLRDREGDIRHLSRFFLTKHSPAGLRLTFAPEALETLCAYSWPGNIRELEHCIRRVCLRAAGSIVTEEHINRALAFTPAEQFERQTRHSPASPAGLSASAAPARMQSEPRSLLDGEREIILDTLKATRGHQLSAAERLGISPSTLYRKMKKLGISGMMAYQ